MKRIVFITPLDAEYGFKLTGVRHYAVKEKDAENIIRGSTKEPDTGLVIIDERLLKTLTEEKLKEIERTWNGVLLVLPSPVRPEAEFEDYAAMLIRRAIGYHVRLKL
jgi:V/A-type H+-transporting ATPase subunit F